MHTGYKIFLIFIIYLVWLIQSTFLGYLQIAGVKPDILLCVVIFISLYSDKPFSLKTGLFAGVLKDILSAGIFGLNILIFALASIVVSNYSDKINKESILLQIALCFFIAFSMSNLYYLIGNIYMSFPDYLQSLNTIIIPSSLYTCWVYYLVFIILSRTLKIYQQ